MSITVFVKTISEVHNVEVSGKETVGKLYTKAACAARLREPRFNLIWEGNVLDRNEGDVQGSGLVEGSVVCLEAKNETVALRELKENPERVAELERLLSADPEMILEVEVGDNPNVYIGQQHLPVDLRNLVVTDTTGRITSIDDLFLEGSNLTSVVLSMPNVTSVGEFFLCQCCKLKTLDLGSFANVTAIADDFLFGCENLESIDLSSCINMISVGESFLSYCGKLETIDLSSFAKVTHLGSHFLYSCERLSAVDMSVFTSL